MQVFIASLRVVQADAKKALIKEAMDVLVAINADKDREKAAKNPLDPGIGIWLRYSKKVRQRGPSPLAPSVHHVYFVILSMSP